MPVLPIDNVSYNLRGFDELQAESERVCRNEIKKARHLQFAFFRHSRARQPVQIGYAR